MRFSARFLLYAFLASALALSTACTRPQEDASKIQITVPQKILSSKGSSQSVSALSTLMLGHVTINVSGEGIQIPIVYNWDQCKECATPVSPSSFTLDIPTGNNRLFQVLAVYMDTTTNAMSFYYGDSTKTLSSASETVDVALSSLGGATSIISGRIAGRYMTGTDDGPSSPIDVIYTPPNKPSLIIDRAMMVSGWFDVFGLAGVQLGYRLKDGSLLFGKTLDLNDSTFAPSTHVMKIGVPIHQRNMSSNGGTGWALDDAGIYISGYFGGGNSATKNVCVPSTLPSLTQMAKADAVSGSPLLNGSMVLSAASFPTVTQLLDATSSSLANYYVEGGNTSCATPASGDYYLNRLQFFKYLIDGNGNDNVSGFRVPLQMDWTDANNPRLISVSSSGNRTISGKVLPGIENVFQSFKVFKRPTTEANFWLDKVDCLQIAAGLTQFVAAGDGAVTSTRDFTLTTNITDAEVSSGVSAVLCPVANGNLVPQGLFIGKWQFGGGGGGGGLPPDGFNLMVDFNNIGMGQCHALDIQLMAGTSYNVNNSTPVNFNLSTNVVSPYNLSFYTDSTCGISTTTVTIPAGMNQKRIYFTIPVSSGTMPSSPSVSATTTAFGSSITKSANFNFGTASGPVNLIYSYQNVQFSSVPDCREIAIYSVDSAGMTANVTGATTITLSALPSGLALMDSCTNTAANISSASIPAGQYAARFAFKATSTIPTSFVTASAAGFSSPTVAINSAVSSVTVDRASTGPLGSGGPLTAGVCEQLQLTRRDTGGNPVSEPMSLNVSLNTASESVFYSDSACTAPASGNIQASYVIPSGASSTTVYFKRPATLMTADPENISINGFSQIGTFQPYPANVSKAVVVLQSLGSISASCSVGTQFIVVRSSDQAQIIGPNSSFNVSGPIGLYTDNVCGTTPQTTWNTGGLIYLASTGACGPSYTLNLTSITSGIAYDSVGSTATVTVPCSYP